MYYNVPMEKILPFVFIGFCAIGAFGIFYVIKRENIRLFTDKYARLITEYGKPLKEFSFLSGWLGPNVVPYIQFRGLIKISVYADKLFITVLGDSLCVPYAQGRIRSVERKWLCDYLIIEDIPVSPEIYESLPPIFRKNKPSSVPLSISLSRKKIDFIMDFVRQAQQTSSKN